MQFVKGNRSKSERFLVFRGIFPRRAKIIYDFDLEQTRAFARKTAKIEDRYVLNRPERIFFQKSLDKAGRLCYNTLRLKKSNAAKGFNYVYLYGKKRIR